MMKILLLGSLISSEQMEQLNRGSREKASVAPVNYETMLAKGLAENGAQVEALSVPAVAAYPHSVYKRIPARRETLENRIPVQWVPFLNIQGLKQLTVKRSAGRMLKKWLKENKDVKDKAVFMYSIYPPYSGPAIKLCKKYDCHICAVIADLPEYMYSWKKSRGIRGLFARRLSRQMTALQGKCDSYVLFTAPMAARMGIEDKPYLVSEGFCDISVYENIPETEKYDKKTIVYGGNLSRLYGIRALLGGFMRTDLDARLHLYGAGGPDVAYIKECAEKDARIEFFGSVPRAQLLTALKRAHLLVVNKPSADDYSNYSFSSKIPEYMASGTALLTTRVGGMPEEYKDHVLFIEKETEEGIASAIEDALNRPADDLQRIGANAMRFMNEEKNYVKMTGTIADFLSTNLCEEPHNEDTSN